MARPTFSLDTDREDPPAAKSYVPPIRELLGEAERDARTKTQAAILRHWLSEPINQYTNQQYRMTLAEIVKTLGYEDRWPYQRTLASCCVQSAYHRDYWYDDRGWVQCKICLPPSIHRGIVKPLDLRK